MNTTQLNPKRPETKSEEPAQQCLYNDMPKADKAIANSVVNVIKGFETGLNRISEIIDYIQYKL